MREKPDSFDDEQLAEAVVALGVGEKSGHLYYVHLLDLGGPLSPSRFVRDWRVVGSILEKCLAQGAVVNIQPTVTPRQLLEICANWLHEEIAAEHDNGKATEETGGD